MAYQGRGSGKGCTVPSYRRVSNIPSPMSPGAGKKQLSVDTCSVSFGGPQFPTVHHSDEAKKITG